MNVWKLTQILGCVLAISIGQLLMKLAAINLDNPHATGFFLLGVRVNLYFLSGIALMGISTLVWVWILRSTPLSIAYPFMALAFMFVPLLGVFVLDERLDWRQIAGSALIIAGVFVVSLGRSSA